VDVQHRWRDRRRRRVPDGWDSSRSARSGDHRARAPEHEGDPRRGGAHRSYSNRGRIRSGCAAPRRAALSRRRGVDNAPASARTSRECRSSQFSRAVFLCGDPATNDHALQLVFVSDGNGAIRNALVALPTQLRQPGAVGFGGGRLRRCRGGGDPEHVGCGSSALAWVLPRDGKAQPSKG